MPAAERAALRVAAPAVAWIVRSLETGRPALPNLAKLLAEHARDDFELGDLSHCAIVDRVRHPA